MVHRLSLFILLLVLAAASNSNAQQSYNKTPEFLKANGVWVTPDSIALNFNDRANFQFRAAMSKGNLNEGCASVADPQSGRLLFYSDGENCWNSNNAVMPNGSGLKGNSGLVGRPYNSTTQGVCVVPFVKEPGKYYLFSLSSLYLAELAPTKLYYSVVDMSLNNGLGDIVSGQKNILLDSALLSESMMAIPGDNCDVWLLTHTRDSAIFKSYHITEDGLDIQPLLSYTGSAIQGTTKALFAGTTFEFLQEAYLIGSMKVAPDRKRLAITCTNIAYSGNYGTPVYPTNLSVGTLLCDFNAGTGAVSNAMLIDTFGGYDVAFSPDNRKLYLHSGYHREQPFEIFQFDLSTIDSAAIVKSKISVGKITSVIGVSAMRLYNDTIYVKNGTTTFDRINSPNLSGAACNFQVNAIPFPVGGICVTLPNDVVSATRPDTLYRTIDTVMCSGWENGVILSPAPPTDDYVYEWSNQSVGDTLKITDFGTYWVKYNNGCHYRVDTFIFGGSDLDPVISVDEFDLSTARSYDTYQWMLDGELIPNATQRVYRVLQNGAYRVVVSDGMCKDTSAAYEVKNVTTIQKVNIAASIRVYPNPACDYLKIQSPIVVQATISNIEGRVLLQQQDAALIDISSLSSGMYILCIADKNGIVLKNEKLIKIK